MKMELSEQQKKIYKSTVYHYNTNRLLVVQEKDLKRNKIYCLMIPFSKSIKSFLQKKYGNNVKILNIKNIKHYSRFFVLRDFSKNGIILFKKYLKFTKSFQILKRIFSDHIDPNSLINEMGLSNLNKYE